ncbi:MAG: DUF4198 domain-containing protein [Deltaproteobacteria bacterium]|nr:DUF4198 domain-containing protein [Deltaproteobacteria bacterium]
MRKLLTLLAALAAAVCLPAPLLAHDLWTGASAPAPGKPFPFVVGYGHAYPEPEAIPAGEYPLFKVKLVGPDGEIPLVPGDPNFRWTTSGPVKAGSYVTVADVDPVFWTRTKDGWSMKPRNETPGATTCGHYIESGKGVVNVGTAGGASSVTTPVGLPLEIVPEVNPAAAEPGKAIPLTVLLKGQPLRGAEVSGRYAGFDKLTGSSDTKAFYGVTDTSGKLNFVPLVAGEWLITVRSEEPYADTAACDKTDYGTSLHFTIK